MKSGSQCTMLQSTSSSIYYKYILCFTYIRVCVCLYYVVLCYLYCFPIQFKIWLHVLVLIFSRLPYLKWIFLKVSWKLWKKAVVISNALLANVGSLFNKPMGGISLSKNLFNMAVRRTACYLCIICKALTSMFLLHFMVFVKQQL